MFRISKSILAALTLVSAAAANADTIVVTSTLDVGPGTLRSALAQADANPGPDTITFHPLVAGTITITSTIYIHQPVTMIGSPSIAISGGETVNPFYLQPGVTDLGLVGMTFRDCSSVFAMGGNLRVNIQSCAFLGNGHTSVHVGVFNQAPTSQRSISGVIQGCSFIDNQGMFGGVAVAAPPLAGETLEIMNCTFHGNQGFQQGGVWTIYSGLSTTTGQIRISNCTITGNHGGVSGGSGRGAFHLFAPIAGGAAVLHVKNSIVAENVPGGVSGADPNFTGFGSQLSLGFYNVFESPMLEPLKQAGGTFIRTPLAGSPCIDAAAADADVLTDQLGNRRPVVITSGPLPDGSDGSDIGAVEVLPPACAADFDGNGAVEVLDIFEFLTAWFAGCP